MKLLNHRRRRGHGQNFEPMGPPEWTYGQVARARDDKQGALRAFQAGRKLEEALNGSKPEDASHLSALARYDAGLGRKEDAIREAQRAVEILPIGKDSLNGPYNVAGLALAYAWTGKRDAALEQLENSRRYRDSVLLLHLVRRHTAICS